MRAHASKLHQVADYLPTGAIYELVETTDGARRFNYISRSIERLAGISAEAAMSSADALYSLVHPEDLPVLVAAERRALDDNVVFEAEFRLCHQDGSLRWVLTRASRTALDDGGNLWSGVLIDISRRRLAEERLQYLASVVEKIAAVRDTARLMEIVRHAARVLTGADGATLVLNEAGHCHYADEDAIGPLWKGQRFPLNACISGWAMLHKQALAIEDIFSDERVPHDAYRKTFVKSLSMVPIGRDAPIGAIGCYWASRHATTAEELRLQQALADATAVGFANVSLFAGLEKARQEAEDAARQARRSEARFRASFEQAAVGMARIAPDGRLLQVNRRLCDLVEYPHEELSLLTLQAITHPDDLPRDLQMAERLLAGEIDSYQLEMRYLRKDGTVIWGLLTVSLVEDSDGNPDYFVAVIEDIDKRNRAEMALAASEARYRSVVSALNDGIMVFAANGSIETCNQAAERILGMTLEQMQSGRTEFSSWCTLREDLTTMPTDELPVVRTLSTGKPTRNVVIGDLRDDGRIVWLMVNAEPIFAPDTHQLLSAVVSFTDITARRLSEERVRQQAAVFVNVQEGIVITDLSGRVVAVNPSFTTITEYTESEAVGRNLRFLQSTQHERGFYLNMWLHVTTKGQWQGEIWNKRKSGEVYPQWLSISAVRDNRNRVVNYIGVMTDIARMNRPMSALERQAQYDVLTGLPNRLMLSGRLEEAMERARARGMQVAVLYLDLDGFKPVNDSLGHAAGDELLQQVAARLIARLREVDTLSRRGGDEFVAVLAGISARKNVMTVAEDLVAELRREFILNSGQSVQIGGSIGIALFPDDGVDAEKLIDKADQALYRAKADSRCGYCFYHELDSVVSSSASR